MNSLDPVVELDSERFSQVFDDVLPMLLRKIYRDRHHPRGVPFGVEISCRPAFLTVPPAGQLAVIGDGRGLPETMQSEIVSFKDKLQVSWHHFAQMRDNYGARKDFEHWQYTQNEGLAAAFTGPESSGLEQLSTISFEHARDHEFEFMGNVAEELSGMSLCGPEYAAMVKSVGLWIWHQALNERVTTESTFLEIPTRWDCISSILAASAVQTVPLIWTMATARLTSSCQLTWMGLRLDPVNPSGFPIRPGRELRFLAQVDFAQSFAGRDRLLMSYANLAGKDSTKFKEWVYYNIKDGYKSLVNNAIDICLGEIGRRLTECGCGQENPVLEELTKLWEAVKNQKKPAARASFLEFCDATPVPVMVMPLDYYEHPPFFERFQQSAAITTMQMCNYLGHWWGSDKCSHSPAANEIRKRIGNLDLVDRLFWYLEVGAPGESGFQELRNAGRGRTVKNIANRLLREFRDIEILGLSEKATQHRLMEGWPWKDSWNSPFEYEDDKEDWFPDLGS